MWLWHAFTVTSKLNTDRSGSIALNLLWDSKMFRAGITIFLTWFYRPKNNSGVPRCCCSKNKMYTHRGAKCRFLCLVMFFWGTERLWGDHNNVYKCWKRQFSPEWKSVSDMFFCFFIIHHWSFSFNTFSSFCQGNSKQLIWPGWQTA